MFFDCTCEGGQGMAAGAHHIYESNFYFAKNVKIPTSGIFAPL